MNGNNTVDWTDDNQKILVVNGEDKTVTVNGNGTVTIDEYDLTLTKENLKSLLSFLPSGLGYDNISDAAEMTTVGSNDTIED